MYEETYLFHEPVVQYSFDFFSKSPLSKLWHVLKQDGLEGLFSYFSGDVPSARTIHADSIEGYYDTLLVYTSDLESAKKIANQWGFEPSARCLTIKDSYDVYHRMKELDVDYYVVYYDDKMGSKSFYTKFN